jgi:uncharacterized protein YndB with AHSA1/START domain
VQIGSDHRFGFAADPGTVWRAMAAVDQYRTWWPWLRRFEATELRTGERWRCEVRPPLPYTVRFVVVLEEVVAPHRVRSSVEGDIVGTADLALVEQGAGSELRLRSALEPGNALLRSLGALARPLAQYGHDWVITTGARQFERAAL